MFERAEIDREPNVTLRVLQHKCEMVCTGVYSLKEGPADLAQRAFPTLT